MTLNATRTRCCTAAAKLRCVPDSWVSHLFRTHDPTPLEFELYIHRVSKHLAAVRVVHPCDPSCSVCRSLPQDMETPAAVLASALGRMPKLTVNLASQDMGSPIFIISPMQQRDQNPQTVFEAQCGVCPPSASSMPNFFALLPRACQDR